MSKNWTRSTALPCSTSNPGSANSVRAAKYARRNGFRTCSATTLPIQGHPDHVQGLSSARPSPELCTSRRLAVGRPQLVGVAGGEPASVDVDLVVDELEVLLSLSELGGHIGAVGLHEGKSFLLVAVPGQLPGAGRVHRRPGRPSARLPGRPGCLRPRLADVRPGAEYRLADRGACAAGRRRHDAQPVAMAILATTFPDPAERARAIGVFGSMTGLSLALGPILGGALVEGLGWHSIFWINVPIVAAAIVCTALFVPESRAARARRFDPVGQTLVILVLGSVVYAIIESNRLGWTSPVILGLLAVAVLGALGILGYEPRRVDPLLELRLG